jgi:hypothetical protein
VLDLRADSSRSNIPDETLSVRTSTDEDDTLASASSREQVDKHQRLDTLALAVTLEFADSVALGQVDEFDPARSTADCRQRARGRDCQRGDPRFGWVELHGVRSGKDGRFEEWRRTPWVPQTERRVERGGQ